MNNIAAHMLCNLTASMRFPGLLNVDLNEITTNLVPYPKLHFLISATTPICLGTLTPPTRIHPPNAPTLPEMGRRASAPDKRRGSPKGQRA